VKAFEPDGNYVCRIYRYILFCFLRPSEHHLWLAGVMSARYSGTTERIDMIPGRALSNNSRLSVTRIIYTRMRIPRSWRTAHCESRFARPVVNRAYVACHYQNKARTDNALHLLSLCSCADLFISLRISTVSAVHCVCFGRVPLLPHL
jgi:hypothetical protein